MAIKKIEWLQKTGTNTYDTLYPKTDASQVVYGSGDVNKKLDEISQTLSGISGSLEDQFVTRETEQTITGEKTFLQSVLVNADILTTSYGADAISHKNEFDDGSWINYSFPKQSGRLALTSDITWTNLSGKPSNATQSTAGLMSATDKKNLDDMWSLFGTTAGDTDAFVNTVREVLAAFDHFSEGTNLATLLSQKADRTLLLDYVTISQSETITGAKTFATGVEIDGGLTLNAGDNKVLIFEVDKITYQPVGGSSWNELSFPRKDGTLAVMSDITWSTLGATAGGDLTGSYPNPTIGSGKVTDDKLTTTGVSAGNYSVVTVNTKGRVTAGYQLFTIGTSSSIPSTVPTGGFYLKEVA